MIYGCCIQKNILLYISYFDIFTNTLTQSKDKILLADTQLYFALTDNGSSLQENNWVEQDRK